MKERELLWQTGRQDTNFKSGGRFAAATVMTTTFIPTRSGDGAFVLEFDLLQYTLVVDVFFGEIDNDFRGENWLTGRMASPHNQLGKGREVCSQSQWGN